MASFNAAHIAAVDAAARQRQRQELLGMNAYDRHKRFVHDLVTYYGGKLPSDSSLVMATTGAGTGGGVSGSHSGHTAPPLQLPKIKTDEDSLRESYRFIRTAEDDAEDTWEVRLAKKYYSRLYREYCIADLSRYQEGKIGLRWRMQQEVVSGRGQFTCGARGCDERRGLASFEVPFGYEEAGDRKNALVKVRLCPKHGYQLNYKKNKEAEEQQERKKRKEKKRKSRRHRASSSSSSSESGSDTSEEERRKKKHRSDRKQDRSSREAADRKHNSAASSSGGNNGFDEFLDGMFE